MGHDLVDDLKTPGKNGAMGQVSDRTYNRIDGLMTNENKAHGAEGVDKLGHAINDSFAKAQKEEGLKGPAKTFELGERVGNYQDVKIYNGQNRGEHIDFGVTMQDPGPSKRLHQ